MSILEALINPDLASGKEMAFHLGITIGTLKVYLNRLHDKLPWCRHCTRLMAVWVMHEAANLGITVPNMQVWKRPAEPEPDIALLQKQN